MSPADATREILWNVQLPWLIYVLLLPTVLIAGWGLYRRLRLWRRGGPLSPRGDQGGKSQVRWDRPGERLGLVLRHAVAQGRTLRRAYAGTLHFAIFSGFLVLTVATTLVLFDYDFGTKILYGGVYLYFQSFTVDLFGAFVLVGLVLAAWRRWVTRPRQLVYTDEASWILAAVFVLVVTGFLVEGWRIAATDDPWANWSPVGNLVARASSAVASTEALTTAHAAVWWTHLVLVYAFLAWAPYTKLVHVVTGPLNIFFANLDGYAKALKPIDFEGDEDEEIPFGVNDLARFTWKDLLDLDACTECGRCTEVCPAHVSGKTLSPRDIVLDLRSLMHTNAEKLLSGESGEDGEALVPTIQDDNALAPESLWSCTTCAACMEACPVFIEQLPKIVDARRYLAMEEAELPQTLADAVKSLEQRGHPYPGTRLSRLDWTEGLDVPVMAEVPDPSEVDVLLWVGCATALMERNHSVVQSLARLLRQAGVRFAILGNEERCTGDPARRIGNEFLFEQLAQKTIGTLRKYRVKKIVTPCPHCFSTFKNDYPALGGEYEVTHHSAYLAELVAAGKLTNAKPENGDGAVTFHDPCYLGRYNGVFDEPRELVKISTGSSAVEMERSYESSFCCGGGGGMSFIEEPAEQRVNRQRAREALDTGAGTVAVACPFCSTMLEDGIKACAPERDVAVKDVAELLWEAAGADQETPQ